MFILFFATFFAVQSASVDGNWDVNLGSPGGPVVFRVALKVADGKLTATFVGGNGNGRQLGAQIEGNVVTLSFSTPPEFGEILITMKGEVAGDTIKGTADYAGFEQHEWSAVRAKAP